MHDPKGGDEEGSGRKKRGILISVGLVLDYEIILLWVSSVWKLRKF
jgi:hypothetical protein